LSFSYWIDNLGFITEGKLAAIFIKPSLGVSNWPVILLHQQTQLSFLASSSPRHQQVFWRHCRGLKKLPHQLHANKFWHHHHRAINKFSGAVAGEEEDFCKGSFACTSFTLF
jgi:hypothetical protein